MKYIHKYNRFTDYSSIEKGYPDITLISELDNLVIFNHNYEFIVPDITNTITVTATIDTITATASDNVASAITITLTGDISDTITIASGQNNGSININTSSISRTCNLSISPSIDFTYNYELNSNTVTIPAQQVRALKFTLDSTSSSGTITFTIPDTISTSNITSIDWSLDGQNWITVNNVKDTQVDVTTSTLSPGDVVYFRGIAKKFGQSNDTCAIFEFSSGVKATCEGSIMSMLGKLDTDPLEENHIFNRMFKDCVGLLSAPSLPSTSLTKGCYEHMFKGCTNLLTAPDLPAMVLAENCYENMFRECSSLTTAPLLPATTLVKTCYTEMFKDCSNLTSVTCLATDISAQDCTTNWLRYVNASGTFTKDPSMSGWTLNNDSGVPNGWTVQNYVN